MAALTVTYQMAFDDLTWAFMANYRYDQENLIKDAKDLPKSKIIEKVKDYLYFSGKENVSYHVGDNISQAVIYAVLEILRERFKEFN